ESVVVGDAVPAGRICGGTGGRRESVGRLRRGQPVTAGLHGHHALSVENARVSYARRRAAGVVSLIFRALACVAWFFTTIASAKGLSPLPQQSLVPGGVALVRIDASASQAPRVTLNDAPVMVLRDDDHWLAVVGVPLDTKPGKLNVSVERRDARRTSVELAIKPKQYVVQRLHVAPGMVELAPDDLARVNRERPMLQAALATLSDAS